MHVSDNSLLILPHVGKHQPFSGRIKRDINKALYLSDVPVFSQTLTTQTRLLIPTETIRRSSKVSQVSPGIVSDYAVEQFGFISGVKNVHKTFSNAIEKCECISDNDYGSPNR